MEFKWLNFIKLLSVGIAVLFAFSEASALPPAPAPKPGGAAADYSAIQMESVVEEGPLISVEYPQTCDEKINDDIKRQIGADITAFKQNAAPGDELNGTYQTFWQGNHIVSFLFNYSAVQAGKQSDRTETLVYDFLNSRRYEIADLFQSPNGFQNMAGQIAAGLQKAWPLYQKSGQLAVLQKGTAPKGENYPLFILSQNEVTVFFAAGQIGSPNPTDRFSWTMPTDSGMFIQNVADSLNEPSPTITAFILPTTAETTAAETTTATTTATTAAPTTAKSTKPTSPPTQAQVTDPTDPPPPPPDPVVQADGPFSASDKLIALTFDDGPSSYDTELLDFLKAYNIKVTFFMVGNRVHSYSDTVARMEAEGHQVASHTYSHKDLTRLSIADLQYEVSAADAAISAVIGHNPTAIRPPYGNTNSTVNQNVGLPVIRWSVDPEDWRYRDADRVYNAVVSHAKDGSIVLLHDLYKTSVQAAEKIIPALQAEGYIFVTVDQLIQIRTGAPPAAGKVYSQLPPTS